MILDPKQEDRLVGQSDATGRKVTRVPTGETLSYQVEKCISHQQHVDTTPTELTKILPEELALTTSRF